MGGKRILRDGGRYDWKDGCDINGTNVSSW